MCDNMSMLAPTNHTEVRTLVHAKLRQLLARVELQPTPGAASDKNGTTIANERYDIAWRQSVVLGPHHQMPLLQLVVRRLELATA
jgi:hypothetical protein